MKKISLGVADLYRTGDGGHQFLFNEKWVSGASAWILHRDFLIDQAQAERVTFKNREKWCDAQPFRDGMIEGVLKDIEKNKTGDIYEPLALTVNILKWKYRAWQKVGGTIDDILFIYSAIPTKLGVKRLEEAKGGEISRFPILFYRCPSNGEVVFAIMPLYTEQENKEE